MHHRDKDKAVPGPIIVIAIIPAILEIRGIVPEPLATKEHI